MPALPTTLVQATVLLDGAATDGRLGLLELRFGAGAEVVPHVLSREDLVVHVLAGTLELRIGREWVTLAAGESRRVPAGSPRSARAPGEVRLLCLVRPAGGEGLAAALAGGEVDGDDRDALLTAAGVQVLPRIGAFDPAR